MRWAKLRGFQSAGPSEVVMAKKSAKRPSRPAPRKGAAGGPKKKFAPKKKGAGRYGDPKGAPKKVAQPSGALGRVARKRKPVVAIPLDAQPREDGERLQKVLASAGVASRRECEALILEGRVHVDAAVVTELGVRVDLTKQTVLLDGEPLHKVRPVYFAVNKPAGVVCTARDPAGRPRVTDLLPASAGRVFNVGRLDMSSEGLILVTNDGELANRLTHPRHGVEKLYHVQVSGFPTPEALGQVRRGVYLDEGRVAFANVKVKGKKKNSTVLEVVLDEGRNREIRRVLARVGHKVQRLVRIAVGPVRLGEMLAGAYRELTREELSALRDAASGKRKAAEKKQPAEGARPEDTKKPASKAQESKAPVSKTRSSAATTAKPPAAATPRPPRKRPPAKPPAPPEVVKQIGGRQVIGGAEEPTPAAPENQRSREAERPKAARPPRKGAAPRATTRPARTGSAGERERGSRSDQTTPSGRPKRKPAGKKPLKPVRKKRSEDRRDRG